MSENKRNYKPARLIPFDLYNISDFVVDRHPVLDPEYQAMEYEEYWLKEINNCITGKWGYDYSEEKGVGGYRFMPGNLYFYVNMTVIKAEGEEGKEVVKRPLLRDIEWYIFYALAQCDGFSGFTEDEEYTCYRPVGIQQGKVFDDKGKKVTEISNADKKTLENNDKLIYKPNGDLKTYITPREMLYKVYDKSVGTPMYHNERENLVVLSSRGIGKAICEEELVHTPEGPKTMSTIAVGDYVIGADGTPTKVTGKYPQGLTEAYEVTLMDGRTVKCSIDHDWVVVDNDSDKGWETKSLGDLLKDFKKGKYSLPMNRPVEFEESELVVDPYSLGLWIGGVHINDDYFNRVVSRLKPGRIPEQYFTASVDQRMELLKGLMDTSGVIYNYSCFFTSDSDELTTQFRDLARSLGLQVEQSKTRGPNVTRVRSDVCPFKAELNVTKYNRSDIGTGPVPIKSIKKLGDQVEMSCITVNNKDKTFLCGDYVVTHNSYSVANGVIQYDFVFGSARILSEFLNRDNPTVTVVGSSDSSKSAELLNKFEESYEFMRKNIGAFPEYNINSPFYQPYEGSLKKSGNFITNKVKEQGGKSTTGTGSKIAHVSYKDNPNAGVGFRARRMIVEEGGLLENFEEVHAENSGTQRRETKTGYSVYIGTGGNVEKIKGIREAFYNPSAYECVGFPDVFSNKPGMIGLFVPSYYRSSRYKDAQGNTNYIEAFEDEMQLRATKKASGSKAYEGHIISYPIVPSEMFLSASGNIFPTDLVEDRLTDLETGEWEKLAKVGKLTYTNREKTRVTWTPQHLSDVKVIKRWGDETGMSEEELKGCIVIYEHPSPYKPDLDYENYKYLVVYDSVKDEDGGTSLACVLVFKFWDFENSDTVQFNLVAEWFGRHVGTGGLEKDHEVAFKLASYYTCPIFPEINLKDVLRHGRMTKRWHYFLPRPVLAIKGMSFKQKKEYEVGLYISPPMKPDLEKYTNEIFHVVTHRQHSIVGSEESFKEVKMISKTPSMRLCEEALYYSRDGNFDGISAMMLVGVANRQRLSEPESQSLKEEERLAEESFTKFLTSTGRGPANPAFSY